MYILVIRMATRAGRLARHASVSRPRPTTGPSVHLLCPDRKQVEYAPNDSGSGLPTFSPYEAPAKISVLIYMIDPEVLVIYIQTFWFWFHMTKRHGLCIQYKAYIHGSIDMMLWQRGQKHTAYSSR